MSRPVAPLAAAAPAQVGVHGHGHAHVHGHDHAHGHDHPHGTAHEAPTALPASLLMAGAGSRLLGALGLLALLWLAVAWALGEPA
jgi:hypothetical protein